MHSLAHLAATLFFASAGIFALCVIADSLKPLFKAIAVLVLVAAVFHVRTSETEA